MTSAGTAGLLCDAGEERRGQRRDEHRPGQRGADRRAEVGDRVLQAADLAALLVGHRRHGDAAELRRERSRRRGRRAASATSRSRARRRRRARRPSRRCRRTAARKPSCTTRRGEAFGNTLGTPTAASSSVIDSGSSRTPVAIADSPSATDRNSGTAKNSPACSRYWKKNADAARRGASRSRASPGRSAPPRPGRVRRCSHSRKPQSTTPPPRISQITGDSPSHSGAPALGCTKPHAPDFSTPNTTSPRPSAESTVPTRSSFTP